MAFSKFNNPQNLPCFDETIGWYKPGGPEDDFVEYLHNPWGFPNQIEKKAIEKFTNIIPNMENYTYYTLFEFFKNNEKNKKEGLKKQYEKLKEYVIENKLIGTILWGANIHNIDREITKYITMNNTEITLTVNSICQHLVKEYITDENVDELCKISIM